ncbi:hypothetical protein [Kordia sp.]|uniref:hypothetical protein n=1 Tax=Kordia sp. TaxID=1965332 RepID=UPI003D6C06D3
MSKKIVLKNKYDRGFIKKTVETNGETDYGYSLKIISALKTADEIEEIIDSIKKAQDKSWNSFEKEDSCIYVSPKSGGFFIIENGIEITDYEVKNVVGTIPLSSFLKAAKDWLQFIKTRPFDGENYFFGHLKRIIKN